MSNKDYSVLRGALMGMAAGTLAVLLLQGCSSVQSDLVTKLVSDEVRGNEIAQKYGTPELKQCSTFIDSTAAEFGKVDTNLAALKAEPTSGLYSGAMKAALLAYYAKQSITDQAKIDAVAKGFALNCGALEASIRLQVIQDAMKFRP